MARPVDVSDVSLVDRTRSVGYPWDEWFDGQLWELVPGKDFTGSAAGIRSSAYNAAKVRGVKVRTYYKDGKVYVQKVKGG